MIDRKRTIIVIGACVLVLGLGAGALTLLNAFKPDPPKVVREVRLPHVRVLTVTPETRRVDVPAQGTVTPHTEIQLTAQVAGEVSSVSPALVDGGFFRRGDVLVQLDDRDYRFEVTRMAAEVARARVRVSTEEAEAEIARREWEKLGRGEATPLTLREPQVREARASLAAAEAALGKAQLALGRTSIKAPFDGRVRDEAVDAGQYVGVGAVLARIYAIDYVEVRLPLHDSNLRYLDLPLSFRATADNVEGGNGGGSSGGGSHPTVILKARFAQRDWEWPATIVRTEGELDPKSRMVHAVAQVRDPYGRQGGADGRPPLAVGMFVTAEIRGREFADVVEVPRAAVRDEAEVLIVDERDALHRRPIEVLFAGPDTVLVSRGLKRGERICLSPIPIAFDGMRVAPQAAAEGAR